MLFDGIGKALDALFAQRRVIKRHHLGKAGPAQQCRAGARRVEKTMQVTANNPLANRSGAKPGGSTGSIYANLPVFVTHYIQCFATKSPA